MIHHYGAEEQVQLKNALVMVTNIPGDEQYIRPRGVDVAAILMGFQVDFKTILAAILSDPRLVDGQNTLDIEVQFGSTVFDGELCIPKISKKCIEAVTAKETRYKKLLVQSHLGCHLGLHQSSYQKIKGVL